MEILVTRNPSVRGATLGKLSIDGAFYCYTLEDEVREPATGRPSFWANIVEWVLIWKKPGITAIPRGRYPVIVDFSTHFNRRLPALCNVPGYSGVRIHSGNDAGDTEGCILVGLECAGNLVLQSKAAFLPLFQKIQAAIAGKQPVYVTVQ